MLIRTITCFAVALTLVGCAANEPGPMHLASASAFAAARQDPVPPDQLPKKTMSDRVLAAIAFERVTGLKPDPARLVP